jgi:glycine/D-amino acid oxidase-like deaminating enzyme
VPAEADVVIVGAGYTGLMAALELSRRGRRVVVLERETVASGASSRNGGMVHPGGKHPVHEVLAMPDGKALWNVGVAAFEGVEALVRDLGIECGWCRTGHLELAHHPRAVDGLRRAARGYDAIGEEATFVARDALGDEIGATTYFGGLLVARSGSVHPARLASGLARAAVSAGACVCEQAPATAIERDGAAFLVRTPAGPVRAGDVVVATNGYTDGLVPWCRRRVLPIGSYIIATEPISPDLASDLSPRRRMFFDTKNFLWYWRLSPDGRRVLFGGRTSFAPTTVERARDALYRAMLRVHPQLKGVAVERAWGGTVALTYDRMPHLGRDPKTGVVYAMGYCGTGVAMATHFGGLVGRWLAGDGELPPYAGRRWPRVPLPARVPQLLPVAGWWYQARDRVGR